MRMNPLFAALDANGDGVIDEEELKNATVALKNSIGTTTANSPPRKSGPRLGAGGPTTGWRTRRSSSGSGEGG